MLRNTYECNFSFSEDYAGCLAAKVNAGNYDNKKKLLLRQSKKAAFQSTFRATKI